MVLFSNVEHILLSRTLWIHCPTQRIRFDTSTKSLRQWKQVCGLSPASSWSIPYNPTTLGCLKDHRSLFVIGCSGTIPWWIMTWIGREQRITTQASDENGSLKNVWREKYRTVSMVTTSLETFWCGCQNMLALRISPCKKWSMVCFFRRLAKHF